MADDAPFWRRLTLDEMSDAQWESLCDGCGRCCLLRLQDEDDGSIHTTCVACKLLDTHSCRCSDYERRGSLVPHCLSMTPDRAATLEWLPDTCAYVRVARGLGLPSWHHLVSGDPEAVHAAGVSVRGKALSESVVDEDQLQFFVID